MLSIFSTKINNWNNQKYQTPIKLGSNPTKFIKFNDIIY